MLLLLERQAVLENPPYIVPLMSDISKVPWNGLTVISTFSGCGGSSLGYKMSGFRVLWANEFVKAAQETYRANHPDTYLDTRDIRQVQPQDILNATNKRLGEIDVMDGSPPCASFSTAGKREAGWGKINKYSDTTGRTDDLFFEFARLLTGVKPKVFVAENVSGLIKGTAKGYFFDILATLKSCGYRVKCKVLDAQWLGVPQRRQRTIFIGFRDDLAIEPKHPMPLRYRYTVRDAIPWIDTVTDDIQTSRYVESDTDIGRYCTGREWERLAIGQISKRYFSLVKSDPDEPVNTICASHGHSGIASVTHPTQKRKFSIAELKRLCGFPDDFVLTGSYQQQYERLGRAVPPPMMQRIADTVRDQLTGTFNE